MKLIFCPECHDIFNLAQTEKHCRCGKSHGLYIDDLNAIILGLAIPIGFDNKSFIEALYNRPQKGLGSRFEAFIIPEQCPTILKKE